MCKMGELSTEKLTSDAWARRGGLHFTDRRGWMNFFCICLVYRLLELAEFMQKCTIVEEKGREEEDNLQSKIQAG